MRFPSLTVGIVLLVALGKAYAQDNVLVTTDTMVVSISLADGSVSQLNLPQPAHGNAAPPALLAAPGESAAPHFFGTTSRGPQRYLADHSHFELAPSEDLMQVRLTGANGQGLEVTNTYTFHRGTFEIEVAQEVTNISPAPADGLAVFELTQVRASNPMLGATTYSGPAYYTEQSEYHKVPLSDIAKGKGIESILAHDGWVALVLGHFVVAWIPEPGVDREYFTRQVDQTHFAVGVRIPLNGLRTGDTRRFAAQLFVGPKTEEVLAPVSPGFDSLLDYGRLGFLARPFFTLLKLLHALTGNWGWAIVFITIALKALLYPLTARSFRSMAKMRAMAPRIDQLRTQCAGDNTHLGEKIMTLYEQEGASPMSGFLPLLVQIPIFIALYSVLLNAAELRAAPWIAWITDLSTPDPMFVLPLVMGATMILQVCLSPRPPETYQVALAWCLPVLLTVAFLFVPAGLALYWTVNNVASVFQQWHITRATAVLASAVTARP